MNKNRLLRLSPPWRGGWIAKVALSSLLVAIASVTAYAQTDEIGQVQDPQVEDVQTLDTKIECKKDCKKIECRADYNKRMRTRTWSVYAEGGTSWATGVWYPSLDARPSYGISPAVGVGVDYNIVPWMRVGAEYLWSRYRGEQRFSALDPKVMPMKTYGNYLMNYHNAKLGAGFNVMELWPKRKAQWLNLYVGTGVGYMMASGNEYGMYLSSTQTKDGVTLPISSSATISNEKSILITGNVRTTNEHSSFNTVYIPTSLHIEADVTRRVTLGLKGELDWLLNTKDIVPRNVIFGLVTARYNLVPSRAKAMERYYEGQVTTLNDRINDLQREALEAEARATAERERLQAERADLELRLNDCLDNAAALAALQATHYVQFAHDSSFISVSEKQRLRTYARSMAGKTLSIVAETSTPGTEGYNLTLSERRLKRVVDFLIAEGFPHLDLKPQTAIGEANGINSAEGRRVTIKAE